MLGFTLDRDCGCHSHVINIGAKLRRRTWALSKLKRYCFSHNELLLIYTTYMRPLVEYVSAVWHSMLSAEDSAFLERLQTQALWHIYGFGPSARSMRERSGLESLHTRRERTVEAFAKKNLLSQQFGGWFQERQQSRYERRRKNGYRYTEPTARTDRFRNFPLNYMRRKLNSN